MVCLGLEPRTPRWQVQTNPPSNGGPLRKALFFKYQIALKVKNNDLNYENFISALLMEC